MRKTICLLALVLFAAFASAQTRTSKTLDIYVVDVEGGNATLFVSPSGESLLIDSGNGGAAAARDADRIVAAIKDAGLKQIDHHITTHYHGDHFGGLSELAARVPIKEYIDHGPNVQPAAAADEFVMIMNAFDTTFDAENEVYAVNTIANAYMHEPIRVTVGRPVRIYLINVTEFDLVNSFHLHGMFFDVYRTGTSLSPHERTDTLMLCQGERAILETTFRYPGNFMFHAHQSEFAELGWMGLFRAEEAGRDT